MNIFSTLFGKPETPAPDPPDVDREQQHYDANLLELCAVELELVDSEQAIARHNTLHKDLRTTTVNGEVFSRVGAMVADPELQAHEVRRDRCIEKRSALLAEHARLKFALGLAK